MATNSTNSVYSRHLLQIIKEMNSIQRKKSMPTVAFIFFYLQFQGHLILYTYKTYENSWNTFILSESINVLQCGWKCAIKIEILYALLMNYESIFLSREMKFPVCSYYWKMRQTGALSISTWLAQRRDE